MTAVVCNASPLIVLAKIALGRKGGLIPSFRQAADDVVQAGLYVRPALVNSIAMELAE